MRISDWSSDVCSSDLFELSGAPLKTIHDTCAEVHTHLDQIREVAGPLGVAAMGLGFQPKWTRADIPWMPKGRYKIKRDYMPKKGNLGLAQMPRPCTGQDRKSAEKGKRG